ncbi:hypothetical protein PTSG_00177 [Salpingoeca rosetta]|uniref:Sister chromatid cohesion protein PDS5 n=1 Tax=Salpingoeca rosetta (strain ATCC 50818 / BSB-021) TaxID=946362 RepID=F2TVR0_SALR5|nr:uncharacterized protein PTSG_00177 [Salpingoeca rosetta]EGD72156.1 hypothetical protein PTSG_00177 [Salpingoeca rosetta]|eukprot:XP_004998728.1 hypothetical protein PTSG_00177 [Salpingoeca rosetta]
MTQRRKASSKRRAAAAAGSAGASEQREPAAHKPPSPKKSKLKPISAKMSKDALIKRLQALQEELQSTAEKMSADQVPPKHVLDMAAELVRPAILRHKDADVRRYAALCLAEFLKHPTAKPFDTTQERKILKLFVDELRGLQDLNGNAYPEYFSLLETIANNHIFHLCLEVGDEGMIHSIFELFFGIVTPKHSTKLVSDMADILSSFIESGMDLEDSLLDVLFKPLLPRCKTRNSAAANLATLVLQQCVAPLQFSVHNYFNGLLGLTDGCESALVKEGYDVIEAVAAVDPAILVRVLPQLEHQLKMEELGPRERATNLLGRIFGKPGIDAAAQYRSLWAMYLGRMEDIHVDIRKSVCKALYDIITNYPRSLASECFDKLHRALMDVDERVRAAATASVARLCESHPSLLRLEFLEHFALRRRDKKPPVRRAALKGLADLFVASVNTMSGSVVPQRALLAASHIVLAMRRPDVDDRFFVLKLLHRRLLPANLSAGERAKRLCILCRGGHIPAGDDGDASGDKHNTSTDTHAAQQQQQAVHGDVQGAATMFVAWITAARTRLHAYLEAFGQIQNKSKGLNMDDGDDDDDDDAHSNDDGNDDKGDTPRSATPQQRLQLTRAALAQMLPEDSAQTQERMQKLESSSLKQLVPLLSRLCTEDAPLTALEIATVESEVAEKAGSAKPLALSMCILAAPFCSTPSSLTRHTAVTDLTRDGLALALLHRMATSYPSRFARESVARRLHTLLKPATATPFTIPALKLLTAVGPAIHSTAPELASLFEAPLLRLATTTRDASIAKRAVQAAAAMFADAATEDEDGDEGNDSSPPTQQQQLLKRIAKACVEDLSLTSQRLLPALKALGYIALLEPTVFAAFDRQITVNFVVKQLLMNNEEPEIEEPPDDAPEWTDEPTLECQAKVLGIKLLVRRVLGKSQRPNITEKQLADAADPCIRILTAILVGMGNLQRDSITPLVDRSRLRLAAGCAFLKLAQDPRLRSRIDNPLFRQLATLVQDSCVQVRKRFCAKIEHGLDAPGHKLPLSYMSMLVLSAIDPEPECREQSAAFLRSIIKKRRKLAARLPQAMQPLHLPEYVLPHVVHLIAHHPDFSLDDHAALHNTQTYLDFLFAQLCTRGEEEYTFLKSLVEVMKLAEDRHGDSKNVRAVCDLALLVIARRSERPGWKLKSFPGDLVLPSALFARPKTAIDGSKRVLPESFQLHASHPTKSRATPRGKAPRTPTKTPTKRRTPKKTPASSAKKPTPQPTRRNASRAAKKNIRSMADIDDDEIERQTWVEDSCRKSARKQHSARRSGGRDSMRSGHPSASSSDEGESEDEADHSTKRPTSTRANTRSAMDMHDDSEQSSSDESQENEKENETRHGGRSSTRKDSIRPSRRAASPDASDNDSHDDAGSASSGLARRSSAKRTASTARASSSTRKSPRQKHASSPTPAPSPVDTARKSRRQNSIGSAQDSHLTNTASDEDEESPDEPVVIRRSTRRRLAA